MIWEHDHVCGHAEDIVIECGGEPVDSIRNGFVEEDEDEIDR